MPRIPRLPGLAKLCLHLMGTSPIGRNLNSSKIPPDEISLIGAGFGGMEEWRKNSGYKPRC